MTKSYHLWVIENDIYIMKIYILFLFKSWGLVAFLSHHKSAGPNVRWCAIITFAGKHLTQNYYIWEMHTFCTPRKENHYLWSTCPRYLGSNIIWGPNSSMKQHIFLQIQKNSKKVSLCIMSYTFNPLLKKQYNIHNRCVKHIKVYGTDTSRVNGLAS